MEDTTTSPAHRHVTSEVAHIEIYGRVGRTLAKMKNLSASGAFLEVEKAAHLPRKGELLRVTVHLHELGRSRTLDCEVVWGSGRGFGISFLRKPQLLNRMFGR